MLSNPVFREKIREWLKVLRKANCAVIMATQSISDAVNSGIMDVINESCPTKIFLPNSTATQEDTREMYKSLGLNSRQIDIIARAIPKRDYYFVSRIGRRLFSLALGKLTLAFVAVSDKEAIAEIKELESQYGNNWIYPYLENKNIDIKDYSND
jgi:type IV secretion system protein VirB4